MMMTMRSASESMVVVSHVSCLIQSKRETVIERKIYSSLFENVEQLAVLLWKLKLVSFWFSISLCPLSCLSRSFLSLRQSVFSPLVRAYIASKKMK